jgi:hypothetical protein
MTMLLSQVAHGAFGAFGCDQDRLFLRFFIFSQNVKK